MKYGLIKEEKCICYGNNDSGKWQGNIEHKEIKRYATDDKGELMLDKDGNKIVVGVEKVRLTADEMIAKYSLKTIVTPPTFNGNYQDYNFVEEAGRIVIADLKTEIKTEREKATLKAEISRLKGLISATDYKVIKYAEAVSLSLDKPYTAEEMTELAIERQGYRTQINELELQL